MFAILALFLRFDREIATWLGERPQIAQTSATANCRAPGEHEQLLVPHVMRAGRLVPDGCLYVASQSANPKKQRQKVADGRAHN